MRLHLAAALVLFFLLTLATAATCQAQETNDGTQNLPPYGGFAEGQFDTVSLQNGNLHLHIPVGTWQQRGGKKISMALEWDSPEVNRMTTMTTKNGERYYFTTFPSGAGGHLSSVSNGLSYSAQSGAVAESCPGEPGTYYAYPSWVVFDPEGVQHPADVYTNSCPSDNASQVLVGPTEDGSGIMINVGANPMLTLKDGTQLPMTCSSNNDATICSARSTEDTNGNQTASPIGGTVTDTMDRTLWTITGGGTYTIYTVTDSNDNPQTYRVDYTTISVVTNFCGTLNNPPYHTCSEPDAPMTVPSKLTLPNGATYIFSWNTNTFGQLASITLPTGGSISYTYTQGCTMGPLLGYYTSTTVSYACRGVVASRTTTVNAVNSTWTYTPAG
jgi:hypothetical protein